MASRNIKLKKSDLIAKIEENKANHKKDYVLAVEAYKVEAKKQLDAQLLALENGSLNVKLNLVTPSDKTDEYDRWLEMFKWEIEDEVVLSEGEFKEYVLDEAQFALQSKFLNSTYRG